MPSTRTRRAARPVRQPPRGLGLVEVLCVLGVMVLLLGATLPMVQELRQGQRLQAVASLLETDIHLARSIATSTGRPVRLVVQAWPTGGSCYLLLNGAGGSCTCTDQGEARCDGDLQPLRVEGQPAAQGVALAALSRPLVFDGRKATVTPTATLKVSARDGRSIHQVVNIMGRVRSCTPGGSVGGLRACA